VCGGIPRRAVPPQGARSNGAAGSRSRYKAPSKPRAIDQPRAVRRRRRPPRRRGAGARSAAPPGPTPSCAPTNQHELKLLDIVKKFSCYGFARVMTDISTRNFDDRVDSVRRFNRLYTRRIGVLEDGFLGSPYSLTQARVLYELARRPKSTATEIATELGLDHGYLSRILLDFNKRGLVVKTALPNDRRQSLLSLTAKGRMAFAPLEEHSQEQVGAMLRTLSVADQERVVAAMCTIEASLCEAPAPQMPHLLRGPRAGDMGWIVARHGALYAEEYGWDERLEALIAEIVAA